MTSNVIRRYASPAFPLGGGMGFKLEPRTIDQLRRDERQADGDEEFLDTAAAAPIVGDDRAPFGTRIRVLLALSILSWVVVGLIAVGIAALLRLV